MKKQPHTPPPAWRLGADEGGGWLAWALIPGFIWVSLCLKLWVDRTPARAVLLPIPPAHYYLFQALVVIPLLLLLCWAFVTAAARWSFPSGAVPPRLPRRLAQGYSLPLAAHLAAELIADLLWGGAALNQVARWSAPLAFGAIWVWAARHLVAAGAAPVRATGAALGALLLQAVLGLWILR